jgi:HSP20 family molecular chaperone IbpA
MSSSDATEITEIGDIDLLVNSFIDPLFKRQFVALKEGDLINAIDLDMTEIKDKYLISAVIPGIDKKDIKVTWY